jgi:hypothetical protein
MKSTFRFAFGAVVLSVASAASAGIPLTLTGSDANATMTLAPKAAQATRAGSITLSAVGNTAQVANIKLPDANGKEVSVPVFVMPATKSDVSIAAVSGALPVRFNSGVASGSALAIESAETGGKVILANFVIDFNKHLVSADIIDANAKTTKKAQPLYTFTDKVVGKAVLKGLNLKAHAEIGTLVFTPEATAQLAEGLALGDTLVSLMEKLDWGTIVVDVDMFKARAKKISAAAYVLK